ncbi:hypothetical protein CYLTODRAFT_489309, partial [Cylindrobasidium torrendii FP15055 ss-10]
MPVDASNPLSDHLPSPNINLERGHLVFCHDARLELRPLSPLVLPALASEDDIDDMPGLISVPAIPSNLSHESKTSSVSDTATIVAEPTVSSNSDGELVEHIWAAINIDLIQHRLWQEEVNNEVSKMPLPPAKFRPSLLMFQCCGALGALLGSLRL